MSILKVSVIHGVGKQLKGWEDEFENPVRECLKPYGIGNIEINGIGYNDIFLKYDNSFGQWIGSIETAIFNIVTSPLRRKRGYFDEDSDFNFIVGKVVSWIGNKDFNSALKKLVIEHLKLHKPNLLLAHSLGSLIIYTVLSDPSIYEDDELAAIVNQMKLVTFGSQIFNNLVRAQFKNTQIDALPVKSWFFLYNVHDRVLADTPPPKLYFFNRIETPFESYESPDESKKGDKNKKDNFSFHSVPGYLTHLNTKSQFWLPFAQAYLGHGEHRSRRLKVAAPFARSARQRKAILVGINEYPNERDRLEGCVNDVFTMSAVLQELGFRPDDIRVCLNHRATADAILERFDWLVADAQPEDDLVFYYSGHGARIPCYGKNDQPDHSVETLVPYDFNPSEEVYMVTDKQINQFYSHLPNDVRLAMIFDCCHAGGLHRGSGRVRSISIPDDIAHRQLKWDRPTQMWVERDFRPLVKNFSDVSADCEQFLGKNGSTVKLGRAIAQRQMTHEAYDLAKRENDNRPIGPYLPMIIESCSDQESALEYRHGATSHGVFTYCLAKILRKKGSITYQDLVTETSNELRYLGYSQTPQILGPKEWLNTNINW